METSNEAAFWNWFVTNRERIARMETLAADDAAALTQELLVRLRAYDDALSFEIRVTAPSCELVLSAGGDTARFAAVRTLAGAAPEVPGWIVTALRQPAPDMVECDMGGVMVRVDRIRFMPLFSRQHPDQLGLRISLPGMQSADRDATVAALFRMLQALLGEELAATGIGHIELAGPGDEDGTFLPVSELPKVLRAFM